MLLAHGRHLRESDELSLLTVAPRCAVAALLTWPWPVSQFWEAFSTSSPLVCRFPSLSEEMCDLAAGSLGATKGDAEACLAGLP